MPVKYNPGTKHEYNSTYEFICDKCGGSKVVNEHDKNGDYDPEFEIPPIVVHQNIARSDVSGESVVENGYHYVYIKVRASCESNIDIKKLLCDECYHKLNLNLYERRMQIMDILDA